MTKLVLRVELDLSAKYLSARDVEALSDCLQEALIDDETWDEILAGSDVISKVTGARIEAIEPEKVESITDAEMTLISTNIRMNVVEVDDYVEPQLIEDVGFLAKWARIGITLSKEPRRSSDESLQMAKAAFANGGLSVDDPSLSEPENQLDAFLWMVGREKQKQNVGLWQAHDAIPQDLAPLVEGTHSTTSLKARIDQIVKRVSQ